MTEWHHLFLIFILFPACVHLLDNWRALLRREPAFLADLFSLAPVAGLILMSFLVIGEMRYRVPFDVFIIFLALRFYTRDKEPAQGVFTQAAVFAETKPSC